MSRLNVLRLLAGLAMICPGCAQKTTPAPIPDAAAVKQPIAAPVSEPTLADLPEFKIPGSRLAVPEWAGKRDDEPFPVQEYIKGLLRLQSDGERWYLAGLGGLHSELADFAVNQRDELQSKIAELEELLKAIHPDAVSPRGVIPFEAHSGANNVAEIFRLVASSLAEIDRAQEYETCLLPTDFTMTQNKVYFRACLRLAQLMNLQIRAAAQDHDLSAIDVAVRRALRLARDVRLGAGDIGVTVGNRIELLAFAALQDSALHTSVWTTEEYAQIQQRIRDHDRQTRDVFDRVVRETYLVTGNSLWALEHGTVSLGQLDISERAERLMNLINYPAEWRALNQTYSWIITDYLAAPSHDTRVSDELAHRMDRLKVNAPRDAKNAGLVDGRLATPFIYLQLFPGINQLREWISARQSTIGIVEVTFQMRRYEIERGRSPATMAELYPAESEERPPIDPFTGEPLKYRLLEDSAVIYSVGKDQIDQGGTERWDESQGTGDIGYTVFRLYPQ